jgi:prolyl-tRNA editing enzyme YbaK/EbsC (Cys-tRNA(Pro) deacylase)
MFRNLETVINESLYRHEALCVASGDRDRNIALLNLD